MTDIAESCRKNIRARAIPYSSEFALQFIGAPFLKKGVQPASDGPIAEAPDIAPSNIRVSSGQELLQYILTQHIAFHRTAEPLRATPDSPINTPFWEFSPIWLFTQQLRRGPNKSELQKLTRVSEPHFRQLAFSIYQSLLDSYLAQGQKPPLDNWVWDTILVAQALRLAINGLGRPGTQVFDRAAQHALRVSEGLHGPESESVKVVPWPGQPVDLYELSDDDPWHSTASHLNPRGAGFIPKREYAVVFLNAYNHVLRSQDSVKLMRLATFLFHAGANTPLLLLFTESLLRHVVLERDISLDRASKMLKDIAATGLQDPQALIRAVLNLHQMDLFRNVLTPILAQETWRLIHAT